MIFTLPWPPSNLSPNARQHWSSLARAKKVYRHACYVTALSQGAKPANTDKLHVSLTFVPPNRRAHDLDNCLARMKSGLDGLADALKVDDKRWSLSIRKEEAIGGFVRVVVREDFA